MNEKLAMIIDLLKKYPKASVRPIVSAEMQYEKNDDCDAYMLGEWGEVTLSRLLPLNGQMYEYDTDDGEQIYKLLNAYLGYGEIADMSQEELLSAYDGLPWEDSITVEIVPTMD